MDDSEKKSHITEVLKTELLGVLSTVNEKGLPEAALVGITETENLELIFGTLLTTRKYQNLQVNPRVAVVVGTNPAARITVQYEGIAKEVAGSLLEQCRDLHVKKNPLAAKQAFLPDERFFKVTPTWIRYTNYAAQPKIIFELTFS